MAFPLLILSDLTPSWAATCSNRNLAADKDKDKDEPPQLVSGGFEGGDTMAAMCIERMDSKGAAAGPTVICNKMSGRTCSVWAEVKQPVTGHLVPIRHLSST
jgi:hypothetical protein